jgi:molecular chaperone DnaK (HSP70)
MPRFRLIDEPSAAALGYGAPIQPGDVYLMFDFGGGTLDAAVVLIEQEDTTAGGRHCRVLGKAGAEVGGATIDGWLFLEILRQSGKSDGDEDVRLISRALLVECERAKEALSFHDTVEIRLEAGGHGRDIMGKVPRQQLEALFDRHGAFTQIDQTIRRALNAARDRGYTEDDIKAVFLVGGSSLIPSVQQTVRRIFGAERVFLNRPLDAVARGAAAFIAGVDFYDHIQHDYAIRHVDAGTGDYEYRHIVRRGTPYPTQEPVTRLTLKASHDGQTQLGIAIFEMGEQRARRDQAAMELVFDPAGAARFRPVTPEEEDRRSYFWINEHQPTFFLADPPAGRGEPRFEVEFGIDENKRLLVTARDLRTEKTTHRNYPVIKLV